MGKGNGKGGGGSGSEWNSVSSKRGIVLTGTDGKDIITGNDRDNILYGLGDTDRLIGADGNDTLWGGSGDDSLHGGNGDDFLYGEADNDWLQGGAGSDYMDGGDGYDIAAFVEIARSTPEGGGLQITVTGYDPVTNDAINYTVFNPGTGDTDTVVNVEQLIGSNYNDTMTGDVGNDYLVGARGNDTIIGNEGEDTLYGSLDDDTIYAGTATVNASGVVTNHADDSTSDTLIFLRYNTDGNAATADPYAMGDGNDVVYDFSAGEGGDVILFLGNEPVPYSYASSYDTGGAFVGTLVTYASDSSILLMGVNAGDLTSENFQYEYVLV